MVTYLKEIRFWEHYFVRDDGHVCLQDLASFLHAPENEKWSLTWILDVSNAGLKSRGWKLWGKLKNVESLTTNFHLFFLFISKQIEFKESKHFASWTTCSLAARGRGIWRQTCFAAILWYRSSTKLCSFFSWETSNYWVCIRCKKAAIVRTILYAYVWYENMQNSEL